jgi:hypothetical protein
MEPAPEESSVDGGGRSEAEPLEELLQHVEELPLPRQAGCKPTTFAEIAEDPEADSSSTGEGPGIARTDLRQEVEVQARWHLVRNLRLHAEG